MRTMKLSGAMLAMLWLGGNVMAQDTVNERLPKQGNEAGEAAFKANCAACHQPDGKGLPGAFPPLAKSDYLNSRDSKEIAGHVLQGITGTMTVNGQAYNNVMPAQSHLSDADIASIINYVYASWGNSGKTLTEAAVAEQRKALAVSTDKAQGENHPGTPQSMESYQGAPSMAGAEGVEMVINPDAPPISKVEYTEATKIFFERCAGCHGVLRKGATGKPLTPDITRAKGTDYLKALINFGSPGGMPNWGTSGDLTPEQVDMMARFLQHDPPAPPEWGMPEMMASWKEIVPLDKRPTKKENNYNIDNFFAVTLRDAGQIALMHTADYREGVAAFLAKRPADFTGA